MPASFLPDRTVLRAAAMISAMISVGTVLIAATRSLPSLQNSKQASPSLPPLQTLFDFIGDVAVSPAGEVFILEPSVGRVRKLSPDGMVTTVVVGGETAAPGANPGAASGKSRPATLYEAHSIATDAQGRLYVADRMHVWKVSPNGILVRIAGRAGFAPPDRSVTRDGGRAVEAVVEPTSIAVDRKGNLFIAEPGRIRRVDTRGILTTLVGGPRPSSKQSPASQQGFQPRGMAVDPAGNLYVADPVNHTISKVTLQGRVTRVAGRGRGDIRIDGDVVSGRPSGDNGSATEAQLFFPHDVAVDASGNLYIAEMSPRIRKVDGRGIITSLEIKRDRPVDRYGPQGFPDRLMEARGLASDARGILYVSDGYGQLIWKRESGGRSAIVAGRPMESDEGLKLTPLRDRRAGVGGDLGGGWSSKPMNVNGAEFTFRSGGAEAQALEPEKDLSPGFSFLVRNGSERDRIFDLRAALDGVLTDGKGQEVRPVERRERSASSLPFVLAPGQEVLITLPATVRWAEEDRLLSVSLANGSGGRFTYSLPQDGTFQLGLRYRPGDSAAGLPLSVRPDQMWRGGVTVPMSPFRLASRTADRTTPALDSTGRNGPDRGTSDETLPVEVVWESLLDLAVDRRGNVYILEYIRDHYRLWRSTPEGRITVMGEDPGSANPEGPVTGIRLDMPRGLAVDSEDRLYIAEAYRVRRISPDGTLEILAGRKPLPGDQETDNPEGKPARLAAIYPSLIAVDAKGTLYIAEGNRSRLWKVDAQGILRRVAGTGRRGNSGDGGPALQAELSSPFGLAADSEGNLYVSDRDVLGSGNSSIRRISPQGIITIVVRSTGRFALGKLATDRDGNLLYADTQTGSVWRRSPQGELADLTRGVSWNYLLKRPLEEMTPKIRLSPVAVAVDAAGGILLLDQNEHGLWKLFPNRKAEPLIGSERTFYSDLSYNNYEVMRDYDLFRAYPPARTVNGAEVRAAASHVFAPPNVPVSAPGDVPSANLLLWFKNRTEKEMVVPLSGAYQMQLVSPEGKVLEPVREEKTPERPLLLVPGQDAMVRFRANLWKAGDGHYVFKLNDGLGNLYSFGPVSLGRYAFRYRVRSMKGEAAPLPGIDGKTPVWQGEVSTGEIPLKFYVRDGF